jgi:hypothetical protein
MYDVKIFPFDTCYTYVLKRTGRYSMDMLMMSGAEWVDSNTTNPVHSIDELYVGDILIKDTGTEELFLNNEIKNGILIENRVHTKYHFMVYEGDGIVSDAKMTTDYVYHIRYRRISLHGLKRMLI